MNIIKKLFFASSRGPLWANVVTTAVSWISISALFATLWILVKGGVTDDGKRALLLAWAIVPPLWFWIEYHWIWRNVAEVNRVSFEEFVHSQESTRNIWLAVVAVIAAQQLNK